ncbi:TolB family protein [Streptomyces diastatochromogenes]|uniref:TolB-like translocation protein n=1 Tax=Streptomyces diastatochromogenes TaxID=42236 RepID=A0A233SAY1_STRDA|nr:TolB-like translocation protein [Streptomyces diastatochromogenes]MCZ0985337.1 TolB-like translocation protein [Streptomyces diastatochromogenes]OXY92830.1 TolB-like translocation protein [Streptomyces diastatochromogenes]
MTSLRRRLLILVAAVLVLAGVGTGVVLHAADRADRANRPQSGGPAVGIGKLTLGQKNRLTFINTAAGPHRTAVASVPSTDPRAGRTASSLKCARFYAAAGTGICLQSNPGVLKQSNRALLLDAGLRTKRTFPLAGTPSRARVSPSGRFAAWTVFVSGESYSSAFFTTRTSILDTRAMRLTPSLETFSIVKDGKPYHAKDINFWGVTFASDDDTFYATLNTANTTYLVRGSLSRRTVTILVQNVECPSLSPDGTRVAFKKRILSRTNLWHEYVLDLRTLKETALAERHSVDDQATWLDNDTVAYALPTNGKVGSSDLWSVPADGTGTPRLLIAGASSPAPL